MPELPEVETVRRGLAPVWDGARVTRLEARRPDLRFPLPERFAARVEGALLGPLARQAKFLLAPLDTGETLIMHLGMSGRFLIGEDIPGKFVHGGPPDSAHDHVVFHLSGGVRVTFNDARRFGFMALAETAKLPEHPFFAGLGPEPLGPDFSAAGLLAKARGRLTPLKALLLDQRTVAGLGNIYVCEALFFARLSPLSLAGGLTAAAAARLARIIPQVLERAIAVGGSSLRDHRRADGEIGLFQHEFAVYGREGKPCLNCARPIERVVQSGRSTFHCPHCQRRRAYTP